MTNQQTKDRSPGYRDNVEPGPNVEARWPAIIAAFHESGFELSKCYVCGRPVFQLDVEPCCLACENKMAGCDA